MSVTKEDVRKIARLSRIAVPEDQLETLAEDLCAAILKFERVAKVNLEVQKFIIPNCGSVSVEWMRAARSAQAIAIEHNAKRLEMIEANARQLGAEKIQIIDGKAPEALADLAAPDAVFIGGGLTDKDVFETVWNRLRTGGRLVANTVTLESEAKLAELHAMYGGDLVRLAVQATFIVVTPSTILRNPK